MCPAPDTLRIELAAAAARLIAEEGCDYSQAKRRALQAVLGAEATARGVLPDNAEIEHELRRRSAFCRRYAPRPASRIAARSARRDVATRRIQSRISSARF